MRRFIIGWLVVLAALGSVVVGSVSSAQGYVPTPPGGGCLYASQNDLAVLENSLSPAINAVVQAGTPVTFSGNSEAPVTFAVASSSALLSTPDLDSGMGTLQLGTSSSYSFTSTKATVTPGVLVYWDASFSNASISGCEGMTPTTYTTEVHTFTVVSPTLGSTEAEVAARNKQEEESEARNKKAQVPLATDGISLAGTSLTVQSNGEALVKLNCLGIESCRGKLTLTAKGAVEAKGRTVEARGKKKGRPVAIGTVSFSISGDATKTVKIKLDAAGRALLSADRRGCNASLAILELAPGSENTRTKAVRLVQRTVSKGSGASARAGSMGG